MSKTKSFLILLTIVCLLIVVFYTTKNYNTAQTTEENQPQNNPPSSEEPEFAIPQTPLGTLGLISALATGFGIFLLMKKRKLDSATAKIALNGF